MYADQFLKRMKKNLPGIFLILFFLIVVASCEIINPAEPVPSYLHFNSIALQTDTATQGSSSNRITDVWLYVDDQPLGAYEMPVRIPVLKEGNHEIKIRAGVMVNGIAATRVYYPFYNFFTATVNLSSGSVLDISPVVTYYSGTVFSLNENFSSTGNLFSNTTLSDTTIQIINNSSDCFENQTAKVYLDEQHTVFECASVNALSLPTNGHPVYIEMNYKTNTEFTVGVFVITSTQVNNIPVITVRINSDWKKIYINLSEATSSNPTALGFKPYIHMVRNSATGDSQLFLDNIKVVHF